jgi:hypothetical protein
MHYKGIVLAAFGNQASAGIRVVDKQCDAASGK